MKKENVIIFGTGSCAKKTIENENLNEKYNIIAYCDNDISKQGNTIDGISIIEPKEIINHDYSKIIICSMYYKEIVDQLVNEMKINKKNIIRYFDFKKIKFLEKLKMDAENDNEKAEIYRYIRENDITIFNYDFNNYYDNAEYEIYMDENVGMYYTIYKGKKMYFKRSYKNKSEVLDYYRSICKEQDEKSPHKYLSDSMNIQEGDIIIDAGAAEGNLALEVIDKVSKVYIIEADSEWVEALKMTFKNYKDKVIIINKFLSDCDDDKHITVDSILKKDKIDFAKMDIEGSELEVIKSSVELSKCSNIKLQICAYHNEYDYESIKRILIRYGFLVKHPRGYMVLDLNFTPIIHETTHYSLRRALVNAIKAE